MRMSFKTVVKALCGVSAATVLTISTQAQVINLTDGNSQAQVDTGSSAGMFNWLVDGSDYLAQQWFWYRIGATPESPINSISGPANNTPNARQLTTTYDNGAISVRVDYTLNGGTLGSGHAQILEGITISNRTANAILGFNFFQYCDFDLGPDATETVALGKDLSGKYNEALQQNGPIKSVESGITPGANGGEADTFPNTLNKLSDGVPSNLANNLGAGPGDVTWAFQWTFDLPGNGSFLISKTKDITIPEPSALALISLGLIGYAVKRSRRPA